MIGRSQNKKNNELLFVYKKHLRFSRMDNSVLHELQRSLVEKRKVYPTLIYNTYHKFRIDRLRQLKEQNFEEYDLPDIPEELLQICNSFDEPKNDMSHELELLRMMIILKEKKECEVSKVIDAI